MKHEENRIEQKNFSLKNNFSFGIHNNNNKCFEDVFMLSFIENHLKAYNNFN